MKNNFADKNFGDDLFATMSGFDYGSVSASKFNDGLRVWTAEVDDYCRVVHKISLYDVYPVLLRDMYDDGVSPSEAADALADEMLKWAHVKFGDGAYKDPSAAAEIAEAHHVARMCASVGDREGWNAAIARSEQLYEGIGYFSFLQKLTV